jgi:hypothetical protein
VTEAYSVAALRARAGRCEAEVARAQNDEAAHRAQMSRASTPLERYAAQVLMQAANCTARHWKRIADVLNVAAADIEEKST